MNCKDTHFNTGFGKAEYPQVGQRNESPIPPPAHTNTKVDQRL